MLLKQNQGQDEDLSAVRMDHNPTYIARQIIVSLIRIMSLLKLIFLGFSSVAQSMLLKKKRMKGLSGWLLMAEAVNSETEGIQ